MIGSFITLEMDLKDVKKFGFEVVQVMATSPTTYDLPELLPFYNGYKKIYHNIPLIIHSPFIGSFVKNAEDKLCLFTREYTKRIIEISNYFNLKIMYVTHLGTIPNGMSHSEAYINILANITALRTDIVHNKINISNFRLCLENDSGTENRSTMNCANGLYILMKDKTFCKLFPFVSFCFDTEHAFASGFKEDLWMEFVNNSSVIHLNPIPDIVEKGKHLDRHGNFNFRDSQRKDLLIKVLHRASKRNKPIVVEVNGHLIKANLKWLRKRLK